MRAIYNDPASNWILTEVKYKDGRLQRGYFQKFDDHEELTAEGSFRFIPEILSVAVRLDYEITKKLNKAYSVVINAHIVEDIDLLIDRSE